MSNRRLWWATLDRKSPRYQDWYTILGSDEVPLVSPGSGETELIGEGKEEVYLLDLGQLSQEQFDRLVIAVAKKFHAKPQEVRDGIMRDGFPIRATDVFVCIDVRAII